MNVLRQIRCLSKTVNNPLKIRKCSTTAIYDPPYLEAMKPKVPLYDTLNIQIKGYDFPILESYQKYLHHMLRYMEISVEDSWATPAQAYQIIRYKPKSSVIDSEYKLQLFERNIQIVDVPSMTYPILLRILEASLPEGVTLNIHENQDWHEEIRYVPDKELLQLKTQLDDMSSPTSKKK